MIGFISSIRLSERQIAKLSDLCADSAQVFLASVLLPSLGIGGAVEFQKTMMGIVITTGFVYFSLYLLRSPIVYE